MSGEDNRHPQTPLLGELFITVDIDFVDPQADFLGYLRQCVSCVVTEVTILPGQKFYR